MSWLWPAVRGYLPRLIAAGLLAAAADLAALGLLATATYLLVSAAGQPPLAALTVAIVSVRALAIGRGTLRYAERLTGHDAVLRVLAAVRQRLFAALAGGRDRGLTAARPGSGARSGTGAAGEDQTGVPGPASGDLLSRMVSDVEAVQDLLLRVLVPVAATTAVAVAAVTATALLAPPATGVVAAGLLLAGVGLPALTLAAADRAARQVAPWRARVATEAVDLSHGAADLAAFGATGAAIGRLRRAATELARRERGLAAIDAAVAAAGTLTAGLTSAGAVLLAVRGGVDPVAVAVVGVGALVAVENCLELPAAARRWAAIRSPLARLAAVVEAADVAGESAAGPAGAPVPAGPVTVSVRGLRVQHPGRAVPALAGVDLEIPPGARVAVVGPSGAGKSTLLAVLAGLQPPTAGTVTVAGAPLPAYPERQRPRLAGGLLADAHIFHTTVRANLLLADPDADDEALVSACRVAGLGDWLAAQPAGLDTVVGEDGAQLSGGERQRLALARALLAAPAVLLLDEPTEGLAPEAADRVLRDVLAAAGPDRSVVVVTHHLRGLAGFDEILVLEDGQVRQRGTHAELSAVHGWYREQYHAQQLAHEGYLRTAA